MVNLGEINNFFQSMLVIEKKKNSNNIPVISMVRHMRINRSMTTQQLLKLW